ncbi:flavodoxin family protein [candidate division KSB1 bacterium]|nr:flavodoxin family protein [candidate division KSB1 bacterium]
MKAFIVYDSFFGNTEKIAQAIGDVLSAKMKVAILRVNEVPPEQFTGLNLLIVGSPTRKFSPTPAITRLLKKIPRHGLAGVMAAAFDTRISVNDINSRFLNFMVKLFGYAAEPIAERMEKKGAELIMPPEGFFVVDSEGPLKAGELERAGDWAKQIIKRQAENLKS